MNEARATKKKMEISRQNSQKIVFFSLKNYSSINRSKMFHAFVLERQPKNHSLHLILPLFFVAFIEIKNNKNNYELFVSCFRCETNRRLINFWRLTHCGRSLASIVALVCVASSYGNILAAPMICKFLNYISVALQSNIIPNEKNKIAPAEASSAILPFSAHLNVRCEDREQFMEKKI